VKFFNAGTEVVANSPQASSSIVKADMARMTTVIKEAGIRAQ
jgi:hypothetical protein